MDPSEQETVAVAVSRKLVDIAEAAGLNPGRIAERALRRELSEALSDDSNEAARREQLRREIDAEVAWYNAYVEEHGLFADDWRTF